MLTNKQQRRAIVAAVMLTGGCGGFLGVDDDPPNPPINSGGDAQSDAPTSAEGGTLVDGAPGGGDGCTSTCCEADLANDPKNCGACGRDCVDDPCLGGVCAAHDIAALPIGAGPVTRLLLRTDGIVFTIDLGSGLGISEITKDGDAGAGGLPNLAGGLSLGITVERTTNALYYLVQSGTSGVLSREPPVGPLGTFSPATVSGFPSALAVHNGEVHVVTSEAVNTCVVKTVDVNNGGFTVQGTSISARCADIKGDDGNVFLYTALTTANKVRRSSTIAAADFIDVVEPTALAASGDKVYVVTGDRSIGLINGDGTPVQILSGRTGLKSIVVRGADLYFLDSQGISKADLSTFGAPTPITKDPATAFDVDTTHVYYAAAGRIRRVRR